MALFGPHAMSGLSPLSGVKLKLDFGAVRAAFDPKRSLRRASRMLISLDWGRSATPGTMQGDAR